MIKKLYFIAGLPRTGSTLLSALLNQNPTFYSGPSSPVLNVMQALSKEFNENKLFLAYPKVQQVEQYITDFIKYYYHGIDKKVIIDKNRVWTKHIDTIKHYFNLEPKIICTVRDLSEIYTSLENLNLLDNLNQVFNKPYEALQEAFIKHRKCLHIVEYNDLVNRPEETMISIYKFLGEDYYQHTFNNIEQKYKENDLDVYGVDLHTIHSKLKISTTKPTQKSIDKYKDMEFWR